MPTTHKASRFTPDEFKDLSPVNTKNPGIQKYGSRLGKFLQIFKKTIHFQYPQVTPDIDVWLNKKSAIKFINHNRATFQNALQNKEILNKDLTSDISSKTVMVILKNYLDTKKEAGGISVQPQEDPLSSKPIPLPSKNTSVIDGNSTRPIAVSSEEIEEKFDVIQQVAIEPNDPQITIEGRCFLLETLTLHILGEDSPMLNLGGPHAAIQLWKNGIEYKSFLTRILQELKKQEPENKNIEKIEAKLSAYDKAKQLIQDFEKELNISFSDYFFTLKISMKKEEDGSENVASEKQQLSFNHYTSLILSLPEDIRNLILPGHLSSSHATCVNAASLVFEERLERIKTLELATSSEAYKLLDDNDLTRILLWFQNRFPDVNKATVQKIDRSIYENAQVLEIKRHFQTVEYDDVGLVNDEINKLLGIFSEFKKLLEKSLNEIESLKKLRNLLVENKDKYQSFFHDFEFLINFNSDKEKIETIHQSINNLISKYSDYEEMLKKRKIESLVLTKPRLPQASLPDEDYFFFLKQFEEQTTPILHDLSINEQVITIPLSEKSPLRIAASACILHCLRSPTQTKRIEQKNEILKLLGVDASLMNDAPALKKFLVQKMTDKESLDIIENYLKDKVKDGSDKQELSKLIIETTGLPLYQLDKDNQMPIRDKLLPVHAKKMGGGTFNMIEYNRLYFKLNLEKFLPVYPALIQNSRGDFSLLVEELN